MDEPAPDRRTSVVDPARYRRYSRRREGAPGPTPLRGGSPYPSGAGSHAFPPLGVGNGRRRRRTRPEGSCPGDALERADGGRARARGPGVPRAEDAELLPYDCEGTRLHARRLAAAGLLTAPELAEVEARLAEIAAGGPARFGMGARLCRRTVGGSAHDRASGRASSGGGSRSVIAQIRQLSASAFDNSLSEQLRAERSAQERVLDAHECVEGVRAFSRSEIPISRSTLRRNATRHCVRGSHRPFRRNTMNLRDPGL